jgi:hypothetical protein
VSVTDETRREGLRPDSDVAASPSATAPAPAKSALTDALSVFKIIATLVAMLLLAGGVSRFLQLMMGSLGFTLG